VNREHGVTKFFNQQRGYSFIRPDVGGKDIFAHASAFQASGINPLNLDPNGGTRVSYEIVEEPKGLSAVNIRIEDAA
jgi:CspA family cold shock protein